MKHGDGNYHKISCKLLVDNEYIVGYKNSDFERKSYEKEILESVNEETGKMTFDDKTYYYYMHDEMACYYCIVTSSSNMDENWRESENKVKALKTAMAREKMNFYKTNAYFRTEPAEQEILICLKNVEKEKQCGIIKKKQRRMVKMRIMAESLGAVHTHTHL